MNHEILQGERSLHLGRMQRLMEKEASAIEEEVRELGPSVSWWRVLAPLM